MKKAYFVSIMLFLLAGAPVIGADFAYDVFSSVSHSNNIRQLPEVEQVNNNELEAGRIVNAGVQFAAANERNRTVAFDIDGRFSKNHYSLEDISDDDEKNLNASVLLDPVSSNFSLSLLDSIQQVKVDRTSVQTLNNLRDINTFAAIPSYYVNFSQSSRLNAELSYTSLNDKEDLSSRDTKGGTVGYERLLSSSTVLSLNVRAQETDYQDFDFLYTLEEAFIRINGDLGYTQYDLEIGQQRVYENDLEDDVTEDHSTRFSLIRNVNTFTSIRVNYSYGYDNLLNIDLGNELIQLSANDQSAYVDGLVKEEQVDIEFSYLSGELGIDFGLGGRAIKSETDLANNPGAVDEERIFVDIGLSNRFGLGVGSDNVVGYSLLFSHERNKFNLTGIDNSENLINLRLSYFNSSYWETFLEFTMRDADNDGSIENAGFDERRITLGIQISPMGRSG